MKEGLGRATREGLRIAREARPGDVFEISEPQFGLPLTNAIAWDKAEKVKVKAL